MSTHDDDRTTSNTQHGFRREDVTGVADVVRGAAQEREDAEDPLSEPTGVQGGEGGGDPAAGAEEDTADPKPHGEGY